eukprot:30414-Pelagococcus_subviridis.AAC.12
MSSYMARAVSALAAMAFSPRIVSPWTTVRVVVSAADTAVEDGASSVAAFSFSVSSYSAAARRIIPPYSSKTSKVSSAAPAPAPFPVVTPPLPPLPPLPPYPPESLSSIASFASLSSRSTRARRSSIEMRSFPFASASNVLRACSTSLGDRPGSVSASSFAAASHRSGRALLWSGP